MENSDTQRPTPNDLWKNIWNNKFADKNFNYTTTEQRIEDIYLELKRLDGYDSTGRQLSFEAFNYQHVQLKNELSFGSIIEYKINSVFEIGCGSGAELFLFQNEGIKTGGVDYSASLIEVAQKVLSDPLELISDEAVKTPAEIKYDTIFSNSVFSYFPNYEYAEKVLEIMLSKSNYSIGVTDIHDVNKKEDFVNYRMTTVKDYAEKYKGLDKFFYSKEFFLKFAEKHDLNIRFSKYPVPGYWNIPFVFNVFMTRN